LPADPAAYARVRRFAVHYEPRAGVRIAEPRAVPEAIPPAPTLTAAEPFICRAGDLPVAAAPSCQESGSRSELLTCFAQAVKLRTSQVVSVCKADVYPAEARRHMLEGTAHIGVSYDRGGKLGAVSIAESSGQPMLDQRALDLVRQSVLPAPSELYATPFAVRIPVVFRMQRSDDVSTGWAPAAGAASSGKREGQARQPRMGTRSSATPTSSSKAKRAAAKAKKKNKTKKKKRASTQT
jgi:TonB family protein